MTLLTLLIVATAHAAPYLSHPCDWALAANTEDAALVAQALSIHLPHLERTRHPKLYLNLVLSTAQDLRTQPAEVREAVLLILAEASAEYEGFHEMGLEHWARVATVNGAIEIEYDASLDADFALPLFLAHELVHLQRDFEFTRASDGVIEWTDVARGTLATYLRERRTTAREYDLLRSSLTAAELDSEFDFNQVALTDLRRERAINGGNLSHEQAVAISKRLANLVVVDLGRLALRTTRSEYIRHRLHSYRTRHAQAQAALYLDAHDDSTGLTASQMDARLDVATQFFIEIARIRAARRPRPRATPTL